MPQDPVILFSWLNTKLRDVYPSLEALCDDLGEDAEDVLSHMRAAGYAYDPEAARFVRGPEN